MVTHAPNRMAGPDLNYDFGNGGDQRNDSGWAFFDCYISSMGVDKIYRKGKCRSTTPEEGKNKNQA